MSKVLIIGIDSLEPRLLKEFEDDLPTFTALRRASPAIELKSIFPIDSIPAWATILTGLNPARHGLIYSFDVFQSSWKDIMAIDQTVYKGKTFWDYASASGKHVCIIFPLNVYPAWPVRGTFISRSLTGEVDTWPRLAAKDLGLIRMELPSGKHPGRKKLLDYARRAEQVTKEEAAIATQALRSKEWELAFVYFGFLDIIEHFFWRYFDHSDPTYPGPNHFEDVIRHFYQLLDQIVRGLIEEAGADCVIVMSDHGHGMRPPRTVNINEYLRRGGFLKPKGSSNNPYPYLIERFKRMALDFVHHFELDNLMLRLSKIGLMAKISKDIYMSTATIDEEQSLARLSSFVGPKSYPYGGIDIIRENLSSAGIGYEELRKKLIHYLHELNHPETHMPLMSWIKRREDVYKGQYIQKYPDILFELREGYGIYWGIHTPLIGTAYEHNLASGGHKKEAVFLIRSKSPLTVIREDMELMDIAPTILSLMGLKVDESFEGQACVIPTNDS